MQSKPSGWRPVVPYLSLADVFICAISIVFILLLLAEPKRVVQHHRPQSDFTVRCWDDGVRIGRSGHEPPSASLSMGQAQARLAKLEVADSLSVRLLLQGQPGSTTCVNRMVGVIHDLNASLSERLKRGDGGSYLLHDLEFLAPAARADREAGGAGEL